MHACGGVCWSAVCDLQGLCVCDHLWPVRAQGRNEIEIHDEPENEAGPENNDLIVRDESTQYDEVPEIDSLPRHGDLGEEELAVDERINDARTSSVNDDPEVNKPE